MMFKALTRVAPLLAAVTLLGGCAGMHQIESQVSTFSEWTPDRKPGTYAFERLPSQLVDPVRQQQIEMAARPSIEAAGFQFASDPTSADVTVQLSARATAFDPGIYDDPFWWHGGVFGRRGRGFYGPGIGIGMGVGPWGPYGYGPGSGYGYGYGGYGGWGYGYSRMPQYEREVALLIRDRKAGLPIYEAHAVSDGNYSLSQGLLPSMFEAAMKDFPYAGPNPRKVVTHID